MKRFFLTLVTISLFPLLGYSQTADEIIAKNLEITGGVAKWKSFNSVVLKGDIVLELDGNYPVEIYQKRPNLNKTVMKVQGIKIILNGYNGKKAVQYNFSTNVLESVKDYAPESFDSDLLDYTNKGFQSTLAGITRINEVDCYKVKLIKNTNVTTYFFDITTYQLLREIDSEEMRTYSDFRKSSDLVFPYKIDIRNINDSSGFSLKIKTIEVNKVIQSKEFEF